jgi:hypothetical protein
MFNVHFKFLFWHFNYLSIKFILWFTNKTRPLLQYKLNMFMLSFNEKTCLRDPRIRPRPHPWHCCTSFWREWSMVPDPKDVKVGLPRIQLDTNLGLESGHLLFVWSSLHRTYREFNSPLRVGYWTIDPSFMNCCSFIMINDLPLSTKIQETSWPTIAAMITRGYICHRLPFCSCRP